MDNSKKKHIKYPIAYFKKVIENMDKKEAIKSEKGNDLFDHAEPSEDIENLCPTDDEYFCKNPHDWVELVENKALHKALKSLSIEEKTMQSKKSKHFCAKSRFFEIWLPKMA